MNININNLNINYTDKGTGDVVLLLHGWGANITLFADMIDVISAKYRVLAVDMPGFGESPEPSVSWCVDDYVDFVVDFITEFKIKELTVLGHSHGGRVIIKMSTRSDLPFAISKIILVDSAGIVLRKSLGSKISLKIYKTSKKIFELPPIKKIFPSAVENMRKKRGSADYNNATPTMRASLVKVVNEDLTHLLKDIKQSTLLIWGENDTATPLSDGKLTESLIPDSGLVTIKKAGHYSFLDDRFTFNKVLKSFLGL